MKRKMLLVSVLLHSVAFASNTTMVSFFQNASQASITNLHDKNYVLSLNPQTTYISYLQSKSAGNAGIVNLKSFLNLWNKKDSPYALKASLAFVTKKGDYTTTRIIVTNPSFANNLIKYQVAALENPLVIGELKYITLVFDSIAFEPEA